MKCRICDKESENPHVIYGHISSDHSKEEGFQKGWELSCQGCGKNFRGGQQRKFCSRACANRCHMNDPTIAKRISDFKRGLQKIVRCEGCYKTFEVGSRSNQKYCSRECYFLNSIPWNKDKPRQEETKRKIALTLLGNVPWNVGIGEYMLGENNPNWRGGISFEPYGQDFTEELKEQIRERDDFICQLCGVHQDRLKRQISIHHIDYNKENNDPENLISLCNSCNAKANYDRKHWRKIFEEKRRENN